MDKQKINGGYILTSRKLLESEIWSMPPLYFKVWMYLLMRAQFKDYKNLKRGQVVVSIPEIIEACSWKVGYRTEKPTRAQIFNILEWLRRTDEATDEDGTNETMIETTKTTRGLVVTISNYGLYQDPKNYEHNDEDNDEESTKTTMGQRQADTINKNDKNVKKEKNEKEEVPGRKKIYDVDSIHYKLAERFYKNILKNNPNHKEPNLQNWANDVRLMMERDNRTERQITYLIDWCQNDEFWFKNILSVSKLREKYDQLVMQIKSEDGKKKKNVPVAPVYKEVEDNERINREVDEQDTSKVGDVKLFR